MLESPLPGEEMRVPHTGTDPNATDHVPPGWDGHWRENHSKVATVSAEAWQELSPLSSLPILPPGLLPICVRGSTCCAQTLLTRRPAMSPPPTAIWDATFRAEMSSLIFGRVIEEVGSFSLWTQLKNQGPLT